MQGTERTTNVSLAGGCYEVENGRRGGLVLAAESEDNAGMILAGDNDDAVRNVLLA